MPKVIFSKSVLLFPLLPLLWIYRLVVAIRNFCYDHAIFPITKLPALVISIGNLSAGGTGKTPLTICLANLLRAQGWKVAMVARGYRRQKKGLVVVSAGQEILAAMAEAGDEPLLMARACPGVPVIVDAQKKIAAAAAVEKFAPDLILVDDGFQHRQLHRDLDIVLVDAQQPLSRLWWFPAAPMREPVTSLRRAGFVILNTGGGQLAGPALEKYTPAKIFSGVLQSAGWRPLADDSKKLLPLDLVRAQPVMLVSGIARPARFRAAVERLRAQIVGEIKFRDHHRYRENDLQAMAAARKAAGARYILTTSKDAVKLAALGGSAREPVLVLETAFVLEEAFTKIFLETVAQISAKKLPAVNET